MIVTKKKETITIHELRSRHHIFALHEYTNDPFDIIGVYQLKRVKNKYIWLKILGRLCNVSIIPSDTISNAVSSIESLTGKLRFEAFETKKEAVAFLNSLSILRS